MLGVPLIQTLHTMNSLPACINASFTTVSELFRHAWSHIHMQRTDLYMFIDLTGSKAVIVELELDNALVKTRQSRNTKQNIHTEYNLELLE